MTASNVITMRVPLTRGPKGGPKRTITNVLSVLARDSDWAGVIAYDAFREATVSLKPPPAREIDRPETVELGEWTDEDTTRTMSWLVSIYELECGRDVVDSAVSVIARKSVRHEVRDYLLSVKWDGVQRLNTWLPKFLGTEENPYTAAIGRAWMISAVARIFDPGCQVDHLLVLEGDQGIGKTKLLRALVGPWLLETPIDLADAREAGQALRGSWVVLFDELDSLTRIDKRRAKSFLTATVDKYRAAYGRRTRAFPRQQVFVATTNEKTYLSDATGNRRYWPVWCTFSDADGVRVLRDQLWAEARARYESGEHWYLSDRALVMLAEQEQSNRRDEDPWLGRVARWTEKPDFIMKYPKGPTVEDVLSDALELEPKDHSHGSASRVGHIMSSIGWESKQMREDGERVRRYATKLQTSQFPDGV